MNCRSCGSEEDLTVLYRRVLSGEVALCGPCLRETFGAPPPPTENEKSS